MGARLSFLRASAGHNDQAPGRAKQLTDMPKEVLGMICRPLSLKDRVSLSITCRTLLHGLASSEDAWGTVNIRDRRICKTLPPPEQLGAWLAHRRQGLQCLVLDLYSSWRYDFPGSRSQAVAQLAACLEGSPLVHLELYGLDLTNYSSGGSSEEGSSEKDLSKALQRLGSCTALTSLTLGGCDLCGLPDMLSQLPALAVLDLHGSNYARNDLHRASWGQLRLLTALTRLNISWCELTTLPRELVALPALAALDLSGNHGLGDGGDEGAWAPLAQCFSLTSLGLGHIGFSRLPLALATLAPLLMELNLDTNNYKSLWFGGEATLGPLGTLTRLTRLSICESLWYTAALPEQLSSLVALQDLDVGNHLRSGRGLAVHPLLHLTALTRLSLKSSGMRDLPEEISHLQALKDLDVGGCMRGALLVEDITWQRLSRLTALTRLDLSWCRVERLPPQLTKLQSLADLSLSGSCYLGTWGAESALLLEQLTALTRLDASMCEFHAVPAIFAAIPGLRALHLAKNPKLGRGEVDALHSLEHMTGLTHLDLSGCDLHTVPAVLAALPELRELFLAGNSCLGSGGVEALRALAGMIALQHLNLSGCRLPWELEVDAIPFPAHRLEGWAERIKGLSNEDVEKLKLG